MMLRRAALLAAAIGVSSCAPPAAPTVSPAPVRKTDAPAPPVKTAPRLNGRGKVSSISITELFTLQQSDQAYIIDARPGFFYGLGHLPGAVNIPKTDCDTQIAKREAEIKAALAGKKTVVVYCTNLLCPDARTVARHLASAGYSSSTLTGGWESWKEAGLPTE